MALAQTDRKIGISQGGTQDFSLGELHKTLVSRRLLIGKITLAGAVVATVVAFLIPNKYTSSVQLMPPDQQSITNTSPMTQMSGAGLMLGSGAGGLMSQRTPGQTVVGILTSESVLDHVIVKNDLRKVYRKKFIEDARKALLAHSDISEDKKSGILMIDVTADDRTLAHNIAASYVERLNQIMNQLGTSSAMRERIFLEQRLKDLKVQLEISTAALGQFSSRNATIDIQKQGTTTMEAASRLQGQLIAAQSDLSGLRTRYAESSAQVRAATAQVDELQRRLNSLSGIGQTATADELKGDQIAPSIRKLPLLAGKYADLYRDVANKEALFQTLTKQYELARVEEAKVIPAVRVLDPASYPEKKSGPQRTIIMLLGAAVSFFASVMWLLFRRYWGTAEPEQWPT